MTLQQDLLDWINADVSLDPSVTIVAGTDLLLTALVDSLGVVEIVGWLQDRTGVVIDPLDVVLENFQTVDRMVALVERLLAERAA
jgi:acyl carrier protein